MQAATTHFFARVVRFELPSLGQHFARRDLAADDSSADGGRERAEFMIEMLAHEPGDYEIQAMRQFFPNRI